MIERIMKWGAAFGILWLLVVITGLKSCVFNSEWDKDMAKLKVERERERDYRKAHPEIEKAIKEDRERKARGDKRSVLDLFVGSAEAATIFKCELQGRTTYQALPCEESGAKMKIVPNVIPTRAEAEANRKILAAQEAAQAKAQREHEAAVKAYKPPIFDTQSKLSPYRPSKPASTTTITPTITGAPR